MTGVVLVVDVANVVGSRPDGWWRDRAAAGTRLLEALAPLVGATTRRVPQVESVVAVLEGKGRDARAPEGVDVVRAPGSGDDALVDVVTTLHAGGRPCLVVTADRGLRARLPEGVAVEGPGWLLALLDG